MGEIGHHIAKKMVDVTKLGDNTAIYDTNVHILGDVTTLNYKYGGIFHKGVNPTTPVPKDNTATRCTTHWVVCVSNAT